MKDFIGATQFLLIPTKKIRGIESRSVRARGATNYFAEAWKARGLTEKALGRAMPSDTMSLAVNSEFGRTQNQLHIHIDCIRADVRKALHSQRSKITGRWASLNKPLVGHHYMAMRIVGRTLVGHNPFKLLARGIPGARMDMGRHTLVVVGVALARGVPGFVILDSHAGPVHGDNASGEELQDHRCELAR